jgi:CheY-like chemotaxis protein
MEKTVVLIAEDDEEDRVFAENALNETRRSSIDIRFVLDGEELLEYLKKEGKYKNAPRPSVIFLDLNMPKKRGIEALIEIKSDEDLRKIPIIVLTSSGAQEDVEESYNKGANSYITKPDYYGELKEIMKKTERFWFEAAKIPRGEK